MLNPQNLPRHIAVIMDGNGRWAKKRGLTRIQGHRKGAESVREIVETARELHIPFLTLYAFSEENWKRSRDEIRALMTLLNRFLKKEQREMLKNGIRLRAIGDIAKLPEDTQKRIREAEGATAANREMVLALALSYGGRQEILKAVRDMVADVRSGRVDASQISSEKFSSYLYTSGMPDPDLLIRTSGEFRVSNFLLWQIAYSEIYITPTLWPDFRKKEFLKAIEDYQKRERRFGSADE
jgi:undecaprenyl diphosphate synthase